MDPRRSFFWIRMPVLIWNLAFSYMSIGNSIWPMSIRTYNTPFDAITTAVSQAANCIVGMAFGRAIPNFSHLRCRKTMALDLLISTCN